MTVAQALNRVYEEKYGVHAPSSGMSAIASLNDILKEEGEDPVVEIGDGIYKLLMLGGGGGGSAKVGSAIVGTAKVTSEVDTGGLIINPGTVEGTR